jgi:hypothetical protein
MKNFIELTLEENKRVLVNVNHVFKVEEDKVRGEVICKVCLGPKGYNSFPYQYLEPKESYDDVLGKIKEAVTQQI